MVAVVIVVGVGGTSLSSGVKLCIDFKLCGLKRGKVFCPLEQGPAIGGKTGNALYVTLLWY